MKTNPIGLAEFLTHYLKYVKDNRMPPVPVKLLKTIDIRKVFNEFSDFNIYKIINLFSEIGCFSKI